jgi:hypothetical protein
MVNGTAPLAVAAQNGRAPCIHGPGVRAQALLTRLATKLCEKCGLGSESIAYAADGVDVAGRGGAFFQFLAKPRDVHVDGSGGDAG